MEFENLMFDLLDLQTVTTSGTTSKVGISRVIMNYYPFIQSLNDPVINAICHNLLNRPYTADTIYKRTRETKLLIFYLCRANRDSLDKIDVLNKREAVEQTHKKTD
jgi:hypothetical protein